MADKKKGQVAKPIQDGKIINISNFKIDFYNVLLIIKLVNNMRQFGTNKTANKQKVAEKIEE